jgi:hypothetical protein
MSQTKRTWAIYGYPVGFPNAGGLIETSVAMPYAQLRTIARRMNCNGDGQRFEVRETTRLVDAARSQGMSATARLYDEMNLTTAQPLGVPGAAHGTCILTAENMHTEDDCTMHDHEPPA